MRPVIYIFMIVHCWCLTLYLANDSIFHLMELLTNQQSILDYWSVSKWKQMTCCFMAENFYSGWSCNHQFSVEGLKVNSDIYGFIVFGNWLAKTDLKNPFNYVQVYACQASLNIKYYVLEGNMSL